MKRFLRAFRIGLLGLAVLALAGYGVIYGVSQRMLNRTYEVPLAAFSVSSHPALLAEGERLARIRGCIGCHGGSLEGSVFIDDPWLAKIVAPDLTRVVREQSDAELERVIRRGVRRDGRGVWAMPSPMFYYLSDEDLGAILAYLRSVAPSHGPATEVRLRLLARVGLISGKLPLLTDEIAPTASRLVPDREDPLSLGRYLALTSCTECHGADLRGAPDGGTPDLRIAAAFTPEAFFRLMREGVGLGGRELGLMGAMGRQRFSHFTDAEITALHTYLSSLASVVAEATPGRQP